jgi:hypothetical protein
MFTVIASRESSSITGRVIEAGNGIIAVAEGWHRGPTSKQTDDPVAVGPVLMNMVARARKNAGMDGANLD